MGAMTRAGVGHHLPRAAAVVTAIAVAIGTAGGLGTAGAVSGTPLARAAPAIAAAGGVAGSGTIDPSGLEIGLSVREPGQPPTGAADPHAPSPFTIVRTPASDPTSPLAGLCPAPGLPFPAWGWTWTVTTVERGTGIVVAQTTSCVALSGPGGAPGPPPDVPAPPTIGEIWSRAALPAPTLGLSPVGQGVTGLETWIWATSDETLALSLTIRGYTVTGTARLAGWQFATGDGTVVERAAGGAPNRPALRHAYERIGAYDLGVTARWDATVVVSGPDFAPRPTPIGEALLLATYRYPVTEVRAVLTE